jgi:hypothetical protein
VKKSRPPTPSHDVLLRHTMKPMEPHKHCIV